MDYYNPKKTGSSLSSLLSQSLLPLAAGAGVADGDGEVGFGNKEKKIKK
jgi:hypothetical protein